MYKMKLFSILIEEYKYYVRRDKVSFVLLRAIVALVRSYSFRLVYLLRIRDFLPLPSYIINNYMHRTFGVEISPSAKLGKRIRFAHLSGIVIGDHASIGNDCVLFQGITLGQSHGLYPTIGNHVTICANSVIVGGGKSWR